MGFNQRFPAVGKCSWTQATIRGVVPPIGSEPIPLWLNSTAGDGYADWKLTHPTVDDKHGYLHNRLNGKCA